MKAVAFSVSMLFCSAMAVEIEAPHYQYTERLQVGERERKALKEQIIKILGAKKDVAGSVRKKIYSNLQRLQTAPPSMPDPFREELTLLLNSIVSPEAFCETQHGELYNLPQSLNDALLLLKKCSEKWQALVAHGEFLLLTVNQTVGFQREWNEFVSRISDKIRRSDLTSDDLLEIYTRFSYFHNQLSFLHISHQAFQQGLGGNAPILESFLYLSDAYQKLVVFYTDRAEILWGILRMTINHPLFQKEYDCLEGDFCSENTKTIKDLIPRLSKITVDKQEQAPLPSPSTPPATPDRSTSKKWRQLSSLSTSTLSWFSRSIPPSMQSRISTLSSSPAASPSRTQQTPASSSSSSESEPESELQETKGTEIECFRNGIPNNEAFAKEFQKIFYQGIFSDSLDAKEKELRGVKEFREKFNYLTNIKFILNPLKKLYTNYDTFIKQITSYHQLAKYLIPEARILIVGDDRSMTISQSKAYKMCTPQSAGSFCEAHGSSRFGLSPVARQNLPSPLEQRHNINDLAFTGGKDQVPFKIGGELGLSHLESLFGIDSVSSTLLIIDGIHIFSKESPKPSDYGMAAYSEGAIEKMPENYQQNPQSWPLNLRFHFVMAQKTTNADQRFTTWLEKVTSGERPFDELCPFSYGALTLFSLLTHSRAEERNFLLETKDGKLRLRRHGLNSPFDIFFQAHTDQENHVWIGRNILYLLPYAKQKIPDEVKKNFTENNIELICAYWLSLLKTRQLNFEGYITKYNLGAQDDKLTEILESGSPTKADALGLSMSAPRNTIKLLISNFHQMKDLLEKPGITYFEVLKNLRPYEAAMYDAFEAKAKQSIQQPEIFFEWLMPAKIRKLRQTISDLEPSGIAFPYSPKEVDLIEKEIQSSLKTLKEQNGISLDDLLSQIDSKVKQFFQDQYTWAVRTGFFEAIVGQKAYALVIDSGENLYLYESLIQEISSPPDFSRDTVPILKSLDTPDYYASITEASHPIADMIQDFFDRCDLSAMPPASAIKIADLLLNLNGQPSRYHHSWKDCLLAIADQHYFSIPLTVREFIEGIEGFTPDRKIEALKRSQLQRVGDYEHYFEMFKKSQFSPLSPENQKLLPSYLFRHLLAFEGQSDQDSLFLAAIGDLLLLPPYSSLRNSPDEIESDPGSLGLASNPIGKRGIWEIHPKTGEHYLLTWCESFVPLFESPDFLSDNVRSILASHPLPLLFLNWLNRLKEFCPETTFHPWYIEKLIEKSQHLQELMRSRLDITFNDILSTLWPEIHFAIKKEFETQRGKQRWAPLEGTAEKDIVNLVLTSIRNSRQEPNPEIARENRENVRNLSPIEGKGVNLNKTTTDGKKNIHTLLQEWDAIYEQSETAPAMGLDEAATLFLNHFNPVDFAPPIIDGTLSQARLFNINPAKITLHSWKYPQIIQGLLAVYAPSEILQFVATLRAKKPVSLNYSVSHQNGPLLSISGVEGDVELLSDVISLFPNTVTLNISHNSLRSLREIMPCLKELSQLRSLNISDNPIHNPAPLHNLPQLTALNVSNTCIHPFSKLIPPTELLKLFLSNSLLGMNRLDIRVLLRPNFLQTLKNKIPAGQEPTHEYLQGLISSHKEEIPLSNLDDFVSIPARGSEHEIREGNLTHQDSILLTLLVQLLNKNSPKRDYMICILERLAETQWNQTLKEGHRFTESSDRLFKILQLPYDPRFSAVKLVVALKFGLPVGAVPNSLAFHSQYPMNEIHSLKQLEISNHSLNKDFFDRLPQFTNLNTLILSNNKNPNILNELPRLTQLKRLDITGNQLSSLNGLRGQNQWPKFENLEKFNVSGNTVTSGSHPLYNGIIFLKEMVKLSHLDLSNNSLTEMPPLNYQGLGYLDLRQNRIRNFVGITAIDDPEEKQKRYLSPQK